MHTSIMHRRFKYAEIFEKVFFNFEQFDSIRFEHYQSFKYLTSWSLVDFGDADASIVVHLNRPCFVSEPHRYNNSSVYFMTTNFKWIPASDACHELNNRPTIRSTDGLNYCISRYTWWSRVFYNIDEVWILGFTSLSYFFFTRYIRRFVATKWNKDLKTYELLTIPTYWRL